MTLKNGLKRWSLQLVAKKVKSEAEKAALLELVNTGLQGLVAIATHPVAMGVFGFWLVDRLGGAYIKYVDVVEYVGQLRDAGYVVNTPPVPADGVTIGENEMAIWIAQLRKWNPGRSFPEPRVRQRWDSRAGLLSSGGQIAAQAGLTAYLGAEALKGVAQIAEVFKP